MANPTDPAGGGWQINSAASIVSSELVLTSANAQAGTAFWPDALTATYFKVNFDLHMSDESGNEGNGCGLALLDSAVAGPTAVGASAQYLGYGGIAGTDPGTPTDCLVGFKVLQDGSEPSVPFVGYAHGYSGSGIIDWITTASSVAFKANTRAIEIELVSGTITVKVDGTLTLTQSSAGVPSSYYLGFTGGTNGSGKVRQAISNFTYTDSSGVTMAVAQTLPAITQAASIAVEASLAVAQTLPALTQSASLDFTDGFVLSVAQTLPALTQSAALDFTAGPVTMEVAQSLPRLTQLATLVYAGSVAPPNGRVVAVGRTAASGRMPSYLRRPHPLAAFLLLDWSFDNPNAVVRDESNNVLRVTDRSSNGWHGVKTNAGSLTWSTTAMNGRPGIVYANANCQLRTTALFVMPGTFTVMIAGKVTAGQTNLIYEQGQTQSGTAVGSLLRAGTGATIQVRRSVSSSKNTAAAWADGTYKVITHICNGTHASHLLYFNTTLQALTDHTQTSNPGSGNCTDVFSFGGGNTALNAAAATYGRVCVFNKALSESELATGVQFMRDQWGF